MNSSSLNALLRYSLMEAIVNRRSRRIMKGIRSVPAGSASYSSKQCAEPLNELEEAVLIAICCGTGLTMPDRPFQDEQGNNILGTPNVRMLGRSAGSADNAQNTHFFMMNDSGTYYINHLKGDCKVEFTETALLENARRVKTKIAESRIDFPRQFPYYFDSNRFLSNLPGSTIFVPVVDMSIQYINGLMYLLTQEPGNRPVFVDDRNGFKPAGNEKWIAKGFLNPAITFPLSLLGSFRAQIEADLLLQNLMLTLQAMGLGGWIHASYEGPFLLGHPRFAKPGMQGLGFRYVIPESSPLPVKDLSFFANPVGLDQIVEGYCPPYYENMSAAVDAVLKLKYGEGGTYNNKSVFKDLFKGTLGENYIKEVPHYEEEVVACVKSICEYIHQTHGRFPAHVDAMHVPGVWLQAHHLDLDYYDQTFKDGYTEQHKNHDCNWHGL